MNKNASHFKGRKVAFEVVERWSDAEKKMIRIADLVDNTEDNFKIFYELKSVLKVPPGKFAEQFIKDLSRADVTSLEQIKWIFDGKKVPSDFKEKMIKAIDGLKLEKDVAEKIIGERNVLKLKSKLKSKFEDIFDLVE